MTIDATDSLAILAGLGAIAWVNWYFFMAGRSPAPATQAGTGPQEQTIIVDGGYAPGVLQVKAGRPVRLVHAPRLDHRHRLRDRS